MSRQWPAPPVVIGKFSLGRGITAVVVCRAAPAFAHAAAQQLWTARLFYQKSDNEIMAFGF